MNLYRHLVPEKLRIQLRNIQYVTAHRLFQYRHYLSSKNPRQSLVHTKKPSICYLIPTTKITGGVAVVCEHTNRLQKLGYRVLIASTDNKADLSWFPHQKVKVVSLKGNKNLVESYDTVVATGWTTAYELALLNVSRKIYFVQSDETRFYPPGSFLKNRVEYTYRFPFEYMTEAKWIKKWLKQKFNHDAAYIPNGINTDIFYPDIPLEPKPKNRKRILLEGAINLPFKGMAEAFEAVKNLDCEVWCVSYDGQPKPEWRCDRFFEKVPMDMMRRIYSSCDILLKLSRVEGFFGPPLEMMACGGVPIVTPVTGHKEYIVNGQNALVVPFDDILGTKAALKNLMADVNLYKSLKKGALKTVTRISWNNSIKKLTKFVNHE